jgi:hypothetical protein
MRYVLLALLSWLTGCDESQTAGGQADLSGYLERLSAVTGIEIPPAAPGAYSLDMPRDQLSDLSGSGQIDLIDFLSLSGCELQINLARRNTQMGRIASPSQRLLLDLEFMALTPSCALMLNERGDSELADKLMEASRERQALAVHSIHQAILMGPEWRQFWQPPRTLNRYPEATSTQIVTSLTRLVRLTDQWMGGDWDASNREFELLLSDLRAGDGGALLLAYHRVAQDLDRANQMLTQSVAIAPLCPYGKPTERSRALERIVASFFVGDVQPWLVAIRQRKELLLEPIQALETVLSEALNPHYVDWQSRRDALLEAQPELIRTHVGHIQRTLADCETDLRTAPR